MSDGERRLAAIMFTDMAGYTALTQASESQALRVLERHNRLLRPFFPKYHGKEVKTIGDSFLVEFESALDALKCAVEVQSYLHDYNVSSKEEWKIKLRIGIHLGDVVHQKGDVFGDAVNIASRIEPEVGPEGIGVSEQVYDQVQNKFDLPLVSLGERRLKNVTVPVTVYAVQMPWEGRRESIALNLHRVAILPLVSISPDPNDEYFADGLTEELIDRLSQVKGLEVIARTSVMNYRKKEKNAAEIGAELRAGALVEGSVRKVGSNIRVTAQLIDANTEGHVWSSRYDRDLEDVFAVQSDIALQVASALEVQLFPHEERAIEEKPTENTEAYGDFLRGREFYREGTEASVRKAVALFEKAIELDPYYARAYSNLATCYLYQGNHGYEPYHEAIARAKVPLKRALELDPNLAEAHATFSLLLFNEDDLKGAEAEARRAVELNPNLPEAYDSLTNVMIVKGCKFETIPKEHNEEIVRVFEKCYRLDPLRPDYIFGLGVAYFYAGREGEATEHWGKTKELAPSTYRIMAEYYIWKGDFERARECVSAIAKADPNSPLTHMLGGFLAATTGNREGALDEIRWLEESKAGATRLDSIAYVYYALGDLGSFFDYIRQALDLHAVNAGRLLYTPLIAKGRADPRYKALREKAANMFWPGVK